MWFLHDEEGCKSNRSAKENDIQTFSEPPNPSRFIGPTFWLKYEDPSHLYESRMNWFHHPVTGWSCILSSPGLLAIDRRKMSLPHLPAAGMEIRVKARRMAMAALGSKLGTDGSRKWWKMMGKWQPDQTIWIFWHSKGLKLQAGIILHAWLQTIEFVEDWDVAWGFACKCSSGSVAPLKTQW